MIESYQHIGFGVICCDRTFRDFERDGGQASHDALFAFA